MSDLKGKKIFIFQQRRWAKSIGHFLAKKLQAEGCRLATLTVKKSVHDFITTQQEVKYEMAINLDEIKGQPKEYLAGDTYSLKTICEELRLDSIWPIVYASRFHVKSYKDKYYYGFKQNVSDEGIINYVMALYKCAKRVFDNFNPDIIIAPNFASTFHIIFNLFAKKHGIEMICITDSKIRGQYIFSHNYLNDKGPFYERIDALNNNKAESLNREKAKKYISEFRKKFAMPDYCDDDLIKKSFIEIIRHELSPLYHIFRWYIERPAIPWKSIGPTPDWRPPGIILRDYFSAKRYKKFANNFKYYPLEKVGKCVYLPLQMQPEETIDVDAPFFNNQLEAARLTAMSLPDDYTLIVKDHPAMEDKRPPSYLEKLDRTVNVKLIDFRIPTEQLVKKADLIVSPSGTTIAEAAFLHKPVIQLGDLGTTLKLPNVFRHTDMPTLAAKIKEVLKINFHTDDYERRLENYVAAAYDVGIAANYIKVWKSEKNKKSEKDLEILLQFYKNEIQKSL
jgi:hypothetical protein